MFYQDLHTRHLENGEKMERDLTRASKSNENIVTILFQ